VIWKQRARPIIISYSGKIIENVI